MLHLQTSMTKLFRKHYVGGWLLRPRSGNSQGNPFRFSIVLPLGVVRFLKEQLNIMLLQESGQVTNTFDVDHKFRFTCIMCWIQRAK